MRIRVVLLCVLCTTLSGSSRPARYTGQVIDAGSGSGVSTAVGKTVEATLGQTFGRVVLRPAAPRDDNDSDIARGAGTGAVQAGAPAWIGLGPTYPNPFNPTTSIEYAVAEQTHVRLRIYDVSGRLVRTLVDEPKAPGTVHVTVWDGRDAWGGAVASGVYFYRLETRVLTQTKKMVLLK